MASFRRRRLARGLQRRNFTVCAPPPALVDVECPRAQFGSESDDTQAVELRDAYTGVGVPSVPGPLHLHDGAVAMHERSHALNGPSTVVMARGLVMWESDQRDVEPLSALK